MRPRIDGVRKSVAYSIDYVTLRSLYMVHLSVAHVPRCTRLSLRGVIRNDCAKEGEPGERTALD